MGLDLVPLGRAKPGHEAEWSRLMEAKYAGRKETDEQFERRVEISVASYEDVGAPLVGASVEADRWMLKQKRSDSIMTDREYLDANAGYYAVGVLTGKCDGTPIYTNGGMYDGVDETSFRGQFLIFCEDLLGKELLERAWTKLMRPQEAIEYGEALLQAAQRASSSFPPRTTPSVTVAARDLAAETGDMSLEEQVHVLQTAGKWYQYWGRRGHPISAWF